MCRVGTLEQRLAAQMEENKELVAQIAKGRENLQSALTAKEELSRRAQASQKLATETRKMTVDDLTDQEQVS